jgi:acyl-CoA thioester hydrolase
MSDSLSPTRPADAEADLRVRAQYRFWRQVTLRFSDLDLNGHVNNVSFAVLFQEGRTSFLRAAREAASDPTMAFSVARLTIDFLNEMAIPGSVEVGTRILDIGRASLTLGQGLFRDGACVGTSRAVMVRVDRAARKSQPITELERRHLWAVAAAAQS